MEAVLLDTPMPAAPAKEEPLPKPEDLVEAVDRLEKANAAAERACRGQGEHPSGAGSADGDGTASGAVGSHPVDGTASGANRSRSEAGRVRSMNDVEREATVAERCDEVNGEFRNAFLQAGEFRRVPALIAKAFLLKTPFGQIFVADIFVTSLMRAFFWCLELIVAFAFAAVFFAASGNVGPKQKASCQDASGDAAAEVGMSIGRSIAVGMGSVLVSGLPISFLVSLQTRGFTRMPYEDCPGWKRKLAAWRMQDRFVWAMGILYLAFATFFVLLFLANVSLEDGDSYTISSGLSVAQEILLVPVILSLFRPLMVVLSLSVLSWAKGVPKEEVLMKEYEEHMAREEGEEAPDKDEAEETAGPPVQQGWVPQDREPDENGDIEKAEAHHAAKT